MMLLSFVQSVKIGNHRYEGGGWQMYGIMLVDDEPNVLHRLTDLIDWHSFDTEIVACVTNGQEALSLLHIAPVNILITDICMPQMDGLALISAAKALNPQIRCIIISAHDEFEYVRQTVSLGIENYLLKPINSDELSETIAKTVANIERASAQQPPEALAFRTNILDRWANSSIQDFELTERAELLQISLNAPEYLAIVATPRNARTIGERLTESTALLGPMLSAIEGIIEAEVFLDSHANLAVIVHSNDLQNKKNSIASCLRRAMSHGKYFAAAGNIIDNAYSLGVSYRNAYAMLPFHYLNDSDFEFCDDHPSVLEASVATLRFEQALEKFDVQAANDTVSKLLILSKDKPTVELVKRLLPLELKLLSRFNDFISRNNDVPEALLHKLRSLPACSSNQLLATFSSVLVEALQAIKAMQYKKHPVVQRALDMIAVSYATNINIKIIADKLNINPSYFGYLFKVETGQQFNDYLTAKRLRYARNLLVDSDKRISEIISLIGIAHQNYFDRLFKKEFGISPVEYRRIMNKKK
jgi:YesN/AraC family two-component response regulator